MHDQQKPPLKFNWAAVFVDRKDQIWYSKRNGYNFAK